MSAHIVTVRVAVCGGLLGFGAHLLLRTPGRMREAGPVYARPAG